MVEIPLEQEPQPLFASANWSGRLTPSLIALAVIALSLLLVVAPMP